MGGCGWLSWSLGVERPRTLARDVGAILLKSGTAVSPPALESLFCEAERVVMCAQHVLYLCGALVPRRVLQLYDDCPLEHRVMCG